MSVDTGLQPEVTGPLSARVERWVAEGEHYRLEYKEKLVDDSTKRRFADTVAAFANGSGGVVLIGVSNDQEVIGFDPPQLRDRIVDIIRNQVEDSVDLGIQRVELNDKAVWVVTVDPQPEEDKPFRSRGRVMVRA